MKTIRDLSIILFVFMVIMVIITPVVSVKAIGVTLFCGLIYLIIRE